MSGEESFESKKHITKHLTLNRFGQTEEATRVNSWQEQDFLSWKLFLARNLTPDNVTPQSLKTICDASEKYRKAYRSYKFGIVQGIKAGWMYALIAAVIAIVLILFFTGGLNFR